MAVLQTQISPSSDSFRANAERMRALVADIADKAAIVVTGGGLRWMIWRSGSPRHNWGDFHPTSLLSRCRCAYAVFSNSSRPISIRRISLVPAPIS